MSQLFRPLVVGVAVLASGSISLSSLADGPALSRPTSNTLRQPNAPSGWQRKGAASAATSASAMPRPFDQPDDIPATTATKAPWAEPVSNDGAAEEAPEPVTLGAARIRHVSGSVNSPNKPLSWRMKSGDATTVSQTQGFAVTRASSTDSTEIRRAAHLQNAPADESADIGGGAVESATEFNAPRAEPVSPRSTVRMAQGKAPIPLDPAVPVESDKQPSEEPEPAPTAQPSPPQPLAPRTLPPRDPVAPRATPAPRARETDLNLLRDVPCERQYGPDKNRNCCAEEMLCGVARRRVKELTIGRIKVDITPTCNLAGEWSDAPEAKCGWQLELSPIRIWKNRLGEQVAHGRFSGFSSARVVVTDDNGETTKLKMSDLGEDERCFVTAWCGLPPECGLVDEPLLARNWEPMTMTWKASGLCHKPLYFEDAQLERYGHTYGPVLQPFVSGAHFFTNIALLPYNMGIHPMNECQYSLGYYRPGVCAPRLIPPFPLSVRGALMEAGAWVGGVYLIP